MPAWSKVPLPLRTKELADSDGQAKEVEDAIIRSWTRVRGIHMISATVVDDPVFDCAAFPQAGIIWTDSRTILMKMAPRNTRRGDCF